MSEEPQAEQSAEEPLEPQAATAGEPRWIDRVLASAVGSIVEAWSELRVHRTRVLLSLIGVAVAVCALTTAVGLGAVAEQSVIEGQERSSGRPALLTVDAYSPMTGERPSEDAMNAAISTVVSRYEIGHMSRFRYGSQSVQLPFGVMQINRQEVDQPYGEMYRVPIAQGAWFTSKDAERLAPAVIINEVLYESLGSPDLRLAPAITLADATPRTAVIVGITPSSQWDFENQYFSMFMLMDDVDDGSSTQGAEMNPYGSNQAEYRLWVPPAIAAELTERIQRDLQGAFGDEFQAAVYRNDYAAQNYDPFGVMRLVILGAAAFILALGALGLLTISLVTVRHRIREIGIRRSFGATAGRVFFSVMMESIVATFAAGVVGVVLAVFIVMNPWTQSLIAQGVSDLPPFPLWAALLGLGVSVFVGALAGLLPALIAVRVKVIDAIRY